MRSLQTIQRRDMPNMAELLNNYGLSTSSRTDFRRQQPVLLSGLSILSDLPRIQRADAVGSMISKDLELMPYAQNINISDDVRSNCFGTADFDRQAASLI